MSCLFIFTLIKTIKSLTINIVKSNKMKLKPIKSEQDYHQVLERLEEIFDAEPNTKEGDELEILGILVEKYENENFPIELPDPVEAIKFRMDQSGLSVKDLEPMIGKSNRVYEVLSRKRPLTLAMIRRLHKSLGIPADVLIAETAAG